MHKSRPYFRTKKTQQHYSRNLHKSWWTRYLERMEHSPNWKGYWACLKRLSLSSLSFKTIKQSLPICYISDLSSQLQATILTYNSPHLLATHASLLSFLTPRRHLRKQEPYSKPIHSNTRTIQLIKHKSGIKKETLKEAHLTPIRQAPKMSAQTVVQAPIQCLSRLQTLQSEKQWAVSTSNKTSTFARNSDKMPGLVNSLIEILTVSQWLSCTC